MNLTPVNQPTIINQATWLVYDDFEPATEGEWGVDEVRCNRSYSIQLKLFTNSQYAGVVQAVQAVQAAGAQIGSTYQFPQFTPGVPATEKDTGSFLQSIRARRSTEHDQAGNVIWTANLTYAPFDVAHQLGTSMIQYGLIDPLERYPEVIANDAKYERYKPYDETPADPEDSSAGGPLPFVNTVGDPLLDPPKTEETRPTIRFIRNESTYNDDYASQFKDSVNSDEFLGYPPNTAKCSSIGNERIYDPDWGNYFRVTYDFEMRDDDDGKGYTLEVLNAGYRQLVNGAGSPVNVVDGDGNTVTDAVPLQENGAYTPAAEPFYLQFMEFPQVAFEGLNIPDDILDADS